MNLISSLPACEWQKKAPKHNHKIIHELCLSQQILYLGLSVHFSQILKLSVLALLHYRGVTTDLGAGISKNVTNAGSQLSRASLTEVRNRKGAESGLVTTDLLDV